MDTIFVVSNTTNLDIIRIIIIEVLESCGLILYVVILDIFRSKLTFSGEITNITYKVKLKSIVSIFKFRTSDIYMKSI